jgi:hypothetical protein
VGGGPAVWVLGMERKREQGGRSEEPKKTKREKERQMWERKKETGLGM